MEVEIGFGSRAVGVGSAGISQVLCSIVGTNPRFAPGPILPFDYHQEVHLRITKFCSNVGYSIEHDPAKFGENHSITNKVILGRNCRSSANSRL